MVTFVINYNSDTLSLPKSATTLYMPANAETAESNFSSGLCSRRHTARAGAHFPHGEFSHTFPKHSHRDETHSSRGLEHIVPSGWNAQFHGDETHSSTGLERIVPWGRNTWPLREVFGFQPPGCSARPLWCAVCFRYLQIADEWQVSFASIWKQS